MNLWLVFFVLACLLCWLVAELVAFVDRRRPHQHDWVAERQRKLTRNAFKSRIGRPYREYR